MKAPLIHVGIMTEKAVYFIFHEEFAHAETGRLMTGEQRVLLIDDDMIFDGKLYKQLYFEPSTPNASFELKAVTIGVDFHWERQEAQRFKGALRLKATKNGIQVINEIDLEDYLMSVISSEMKSSAPTEFLKAHAVISRSWLFAQIEKKHSPETREPLYNSLQKTNDKIIKWYDREDHKDFDVCADDHCQRYQGITRGLSSEIEDIVNATRGIVITYDDKICDARFSKCCGGVTEEFEHCWEPVHHEYLKAVRDNVDDGKRIPDLSDEFEAERWIRTKPISYCNTTDSLLLSKVLNSYDQETKNFYRWEVKFTQWEISELISRKTGIDFGNIIDLIPMERGTSGRIEELQIVGDKKTLTIGKELEIRRILSESHLYSSAFVVDKTYSESNGIKGFILHGAGWGHGVGLCQVGAAVMGMNGFKYNEILNHYYPGSDLQKRY